MLPIDRVICPSQTRNMQATAYNELYEVVARQQPDRRVKFITQTGKRMHVNRTAMPTHRWGVGTAHGGPRSAVGRATTAGRCVARPKFAPPGEAASGQR